MSRALRRRDARAVRGAQSSPNMAPMVDVTLVILIFFMASAAFVGPEWALQLGLAREGGGSGALPGARFTVRIEQSDAGVRYAGLGVVADDAETMAATAAQVAAGAPGSSFVLVPAGVTAYQRVLDAHAAFTDLGLEVLVQPLPDR